MSDEAPRKGYVLAVSGIGDSYIPNAIHVERDDEQFLFSDDEEAALAAERDGVKLIYDLEGVPDGVYLDTPENRAAILDSLEQYPEYRCTRGLETELHFM